MYFNHDNALQNLKELNDTIEEHLPKLIDIADKFQTNMPNAYMSEAHTKMKAQQ